MRMPTLLEKVIQADGYRNECVQGEIVIPTGQLRLDLLEQTSSE
jgi:hypothetical protein